MKVKIPKRENAPETNLYVNVITAPNNTFGNRPIILLVPGGPGGNHTVYRSIKTNLLQYADLILFDPRGCGYSDQSDTSHCSLEHYMEDIEALRQHFNLSKMTLFGGSYGAMASLGYAIKYGEFLDNLILLAGSPSYRFLETAKANLKKRGTPEQIKATADLFAGTFKDDEHFKKFYQTTCSLYLFNETKKEHKPPTIEPNIPYNTAITNFGFADFLKKFNFEPDLKNITCKTLIMVGQYDWINDPMHAKYMADQIPNAQFVIFDKCGHFIWADQRERFFKTLDEYMKANNSSNPRNLPQ